MSNAIVQPLARPSGIYTEPGLLIQRTNTSASESLWSDVVLSKHNIYCTARV